MAGWIKKHLKLGRFVALMKDQVSLGRAMAKPGILSQIDFAVLRATGHEEDILDKETIELVLEAGDRSRMCVSHCIRLLMDRLSKTQSWVVAVRCLLVIHYGLHEGGFMFQDQLTVCPSRGGYNYLNLSRFRDSSSPFTWAASAWVRWYAKFVEQWIQTSKNLGIFFTFKKDEKALHTEKLILLANWQIVKQIISLEEFLHEAAAWEAEDFVMDHVLVKGALPFISITTRKAYIGIKLRFQEIMERIPTITQMEASTLFDVCETLSEDSTSLTNLFETVNSTHNEVYMMLELKKLKQTLKHASLHNQSTSFEQVYQMHGLSPKCQSARWEEAPSSKHRIKDLRRGNSVCEFSFHESFQKKF